MDLRGEYVGVTLSGSGARVSDKMNCDECKNLISVFLDSELDEPTAAEIRSHLATCNGCAGVCEDFASILDVVTEVPADSIPPNPQALWCRINNIIESEIKPPPPVESQRQEPFSRRFSFGQLAAAVLSVAIVSSFFTVLMVRSYFPPAADEFSSRTNAERTFLDRALARLGLAETPQQIRERRIRQHQEAIEYWNARIQSRRSNWDALTREAFDRNLRVIDQSVSQFKVNLERNPEDEISGEMLDSVLDDKMKLLRDFADL